MNVKQIKLLKKLALVVAVASFGFQANAQTVEEGIRHLDAERYTAAGKVFNQLATNQTPENLFYQGYYLLRTPEALSAQTLSQAKAAFEKANSLGKRPDAMNQVGLGMVKYAQKDFAGAKALFDEAVKMTKGKNADILNRIGEAHVMFHQAGGPTDPAEAVKFAEQAIVASKGKPTADFFQTKAAAYYIMNDGGEAMNALQNAERLSNYKASIYAKMGQIWLQGRNYKEAQEALDKAVAADPTFSTTYKYLASYHQIFQNWDKAAEAAKNYYKNSDADCGAKLRYAQYAFIGKDFKNMLNTIDEIKDCNTNPVVNRLAGIANFEMGKPQEAISLLNKFLASAPKEQHLGLDYGFIGRSYLAMTDEANRAANDSLGILNIEKAVAMNDTTFDYYGKVADLFKTRKNFPKAIEYYNKAMSSKKNVNGADLANLGSLYLSAKDWTKADETFEKVVEAYKGKWPDAFYYSGLAKYYRYGSSDATFPSAARFAEYVAAVPEAQIASRKPQLNFAYNVLVGKSLYADKDMTKAQELVTKWLAVDPANQQALSAQATIQSGGASTTTTTPATTTVPPKK